MESGKNNDKKGLLKTVTRGAVDQPPEVEWFANIISPRTKRAYQNDLAGFMQFVGIKTPLEFRLVTRAHLIAFRKSLEEKAVTGATIRRKLACLSSQNRLWAREAPVLNRQQPAMFSPRRPQTMAQGRQPYCGAAPAAVGDPTSSMTPGLSCARWGSFPAKGPGNGAAGLFNGYALSREAG
jgi:Phage integrase, N-terminal SAM-like domain